MSNRPVVLVFCQPLPVEVELAPVPGLDPEDSTFVLTPQSGQPPLGLLYLASELERSGYGVVIKDGSVSPAAENELAQDIIALNPLAVGFSLSVLNQRNTKHVSMLVKQAIPGTPIVWGGPQATIDPMGAADLDYVDLVITHQGEIAFRSVIDDIHRGAFAKAASPERKIMRGMMPESLDQLAPPARHLVDLSKYGRRSSAMDVWPTDTINTSRGCPFACTFCSSRIVWDRRYHKRSPKNVVDEIEFLIHEYGSRGFYFREDNFTVDRAHVRGVCDEILRRGLKIKWECESRVDTVSKQDLILMKRAGLSGFWCGVESGSQRMLDAIKKGYKVEQVREFYSWCDELRIPAGASFIFGFPGERPEEIAATFELGRELPCVWVRYGTYVGFPGSELYEKTLKSGLYEARWDDILIARNEYFTAAQLRALENAMNRDGKKVRKRTLSKMMQIAATRPRRILGAMAERINSGRVRSRHTGHSSGEQTKPKESFYSLLKRFA